MSDIRLLNESGFGLRSLRGPGGLNIQLLPSACLYAIEHGKILINQVLASPIASGVHRIYLRIHDDDGIRAICIVGPGAQSRVAASADAFVWSGEEQGIQFRCTCTIHPDRDAWFFRIEIENRGDRPARCDAILLQDIGLATRGQVRNNELFTSQYIDHFAAEHPEFGYVVMSRQNLPQPGETHPWLMQGCFPKAVGFLTDGFAFFGTGYRAGAPAIALGRANIGTKVRQSELAYTAIQSSLVELKPSASFAWTFFANFASDHPERSSTADLARIDAITEPTTKQAVEFVPQRSVFDNCLIYKSDDLMERDVDEMFSEPRRHAESLNGTLVSFFYGKDARHVVLRGKEASLERSNGHILRAGKGLMPDDEIMSCTCWAAGVFASQLTLGNASVAKLFSGTRDPLNVIRSGGLRIFVRRDKSEAWQLLAVPSAFEMGLNECCWHYKQGEKLLTVRCSATENEPALTFDVRVDGAAVELLICGEICAGGMEYDTSPRLWIDREEKRITVRPDPTSMLGKKQPELAFHIAASNPESVESIGGDAHGYPYVTIQTRPITSFSFIVTGSILDRPRDTSPDKGLAFWRGITAGVRVSSDVIQDALTWYARDAVIHLSAPRGLDQPNGGAWGTRDVCQGAVEFLLSYGHNETVAEILRRLFSQQYQHRHDWPQWFMFPPFQQIQSPHCHGDVAIWPLKALCDYLEQTNDAAILHERLPYTDEETFQQTEHREELLQHVDRLIERLREQFLPGLALPRFGEGDWDDSLQPADPSLRQRMVSSWTTELMYQTLKRYAAAMERMGQKQRAAGAGQLAQKIHADFHRYLMPDGIVAGFAIFDGDPPRPVEYLLHPSDRRTGIHYRLIPMTRGILSEMFSPKQAQDHLSLIREHLLCPDGARLMDRPTVYDGGRERTFRRSESAAFFGREIGLQYVHAHLRYAEALAKLGRADDLWHALQVVNPIAVTQLVPNARPRQRNCYFSSSDARFDDRYQASRDYGKLRDGQIPTDGGWRIYSSGPGIYTNLVICHLLGLRERFDCVEFDPVLPRELDGLTCEIDWKGRRIRYEFCVREGQFAPRGLSVNGRALATREGSPNGYRRGGICIPKAEFERALIVGENQVHIIV